jgi:hypothetical protein
MFYLFLILLLCPGVHSALIVPKILFTYQSQDVSFPQWTVFFTTCLAPLIAHVAGGVVSPTILGSLSQGPTWISYLTHFNPISIIWRYYIIIDRRVRARSWDQCDMAACNAVFWDAERKRWDGSEEIMVRSRAWITKMPEKPHVRLLSASSFTTLVQTEQGAQIMFYIIEGYIAGSEHIPQGLPGVFAGLQLLGLIRLFASLWLSSDYSYMNFRGTDLGLEISETPLESHVSKNILESRVSNHLLEVDVRDRLLPLHCWQGILYRAFWLLTIWGILGPAAGACSQVFWHYPPGVPYESATRLVWQIMYFALSLFGISIHTFYIIRGKTHSTIIPCIHQSWYRIFTIFLFIMVVICTVFSCLETRVRLDGAVTTLPELLCGEAGALCFPVGKGQGNTNV